MELGSPEGFFGCLLWYLDALETSFALNLIILVGATFYVRHAGGNQLAVGYTSVSIAFATFTVILAFQLLSVTGIVQYLTRKCAVVTIRNGHQVEDEDDPLLSDRLKNPQEYEPPFHTPHITGEPTEEMVNEAQRRRISVYTYGSIN